MGKLLPIIFIDLTPFLGAMLGYFFYLRLRSKWRRSREKAAGPASLNKGGKI